MRDGRGEVTNDTLHNRNGTSSTFVLHLKVMSITEYLAATMPGPAKCHTARLPRSVRRKYFLHIGNNTLNDMFIDAADGQEASQTRTNGR